MRPRPITAAPASAASTSARPSAFPAPYQLDARRCIAYLTIEHKGHIPAEFREAIGNRVFGCDDCLAVCPWNKFAAAARQHQAAGAGPGQLAAARASCWRWTMPPSASASPGTPVKRTGRDRVLRNALIAAGNSGDAELDSRGRAPAGRCLAPGARHGGVGAAALDGASRLELSQGAVALGARRTRMCGRSGAWRPADAALLLRIRLLRGKPGAAVEPARGDGCRHAHAPGRRARGQRHAGRLHGRRGLG